MTAHALRQGKRPDAPVHIADGRLCCAKCGRTLVLDFAALRRAAPDRAFEMARHGCTSCNRADERLPSQILKAIRVADAIVPERKRPTALAVVICAGLAGILTLAVLFLI